MTTTHKLDTLPATAERLDAYLTRRTNNPICGTDYWLAECLSENIQVRDYYNPRWRMYDRKLWFVRHFTGLEWVHLLDLEPGERPRMHNSYCYIVTEEST